MRHGVVRGIEVIKLAPVLICNEVRCVRIQQLEIMLHRDCILSIFQRRKDELVAEAIEQSTDDVTVRPHVALREDFFFEDVVWREETHLFNVDGNGCSVFGGSIRLMRDGDIQFRAMALGVCF